jgi:phospholipase/carboxylesterase
MNIFRLFFSFLCLFVCFFPLSAGAGPEFKEEAIDHHRCLVIDPDHLTTQTPLVLVLHGYGGDAQNLIPVWKYLDMPPCRVVFCEAIYSLPEGGFAWYHKLFSDNRRDILESRVHLYKVIQHYLADMPGHDPHPVVLIGFSQGGVMSVETGVNYAGKIAAIVSMSGYMPEPGKTLEKPKAPLDTPILLIHGNEDAIVPITLGHQMNDALKAAGFKPLLKEFSMGHEIRKESLAAVQDFLSRALIQSNP